MKIYQLESLPSPILRKFSLQMDESVWGSSRLTREEKALRCMFAILVWISVWKGGIQNITKDMGVAAHACSHSTREAEERGLPSVSGQPSNIMSSRPICATEWHHHPQTTKTAAAAAVAAATTNEEETGEGVLELIPWFFMDLCLHQHDTCDCCGTSQLSGCSFALSILGPCMGEKCFHRPCRGPWVFKV